MPGQRCRLAGDALHHAAVAAQGINIEIEHRKVGAIESRRRPARGERHADAGGQSLPERPGGGFDAAGPAVFRMAGAFAVELAKTLEFIERHGRLAEALVLAVDRLDTSEMEQR